MPPPTSPPAPTFAAPARYDARRSLLGLWWLRRTDDRHRAEGFYLISAVLLVAAFLVAGGLLWALAERGVLTELQAFGAQVGGGAVIALGALAGWRPRVVAQCAHDRLIVEQGKARREVPYEAIRSATCLPASRFHRHEARYRATDLYLGRLSETILVVRIAEANGDGIVALGLPPGEQVGLLRHIESRLAVQVR